MNKFQHSYYFSHKRCDFTCNRVSVLNRGFADVRGRGAEKTQLWYASSAFAMGNFKKLLSFNISAADHVARHVAADLESERHEYQTHISQPNKPNNRQR